MSLAAKAARAQAMAESLMVDECTISRPGANPGDADVTTYSGKCRVRVTQTVQVAAGTPGTELGHYRTEIHIPVSASGVQFNDKVSITASINPALVGTSTYISGMPAQTAGSAQRLWCERDLR